MKAKYIIIASLCAIAAGAIITVYPTVKELNSLCKKYNV